MLTGRLTKPLAIGAVVVVIGGGAYGVVGATSGSGSAGASTAQTAQPGSNARSGPAAGGVSGTVSSVSASSFTVSTSAGQKVTVHTTSSTTASAIKKGTPVLVLGTTSGTTITATRVIVRPTGGGSTTYTPSKVTPFKRGAPTTPKQDGQVPTNYTEGSGTIVAGTTANKAIEAALAAYPGGVVDRVVKLSDGEYEVHNIGVSWPHHIFVSKSFKVVGAN